MAALKCPRCATLVRVEAGVDPICPQCGFSGANPLAAAPVTLAPDPAPVPPDPAPSAPAPVGAAAASPLDAPPAARERAPVIIAVVVAVLLLVGGFAFAYSAGFFGLGKGGSVTEEQLRAALGSFTSSTSGSGAGSDEALGIEGSVKGGPGGELPAGFTITYRMLFDAGRHAYEFSYAGGGGGVTVDVGVKQVGAVINYVQGDKTYEGRDEDPSTLPDLFDDEFASHSQFSAGLLDEAGIAIESKEGVRHHGEPATRFVVHADENPEEHGTIIVYDDSLRIARAEFVVGGASVVMDVLYGREVDVDVSTGHPRASFVLGDALFGSYEFGDCNYDESSARVCTVPDTHAQEVKLSEVELRALEGSGENGQVVARLRADAGSTDSGGVRLAYEDVDGDGLLSAGDRYSYDFGDRLLTFQFYDLWADQPAGGPGMGLPAPGPLMMLAALALGAAIGRRRAR
jgi:hypothetical protein